MTNFSTVYSENFPNEMSVSVTKSPIKDCKIPTNGDDDDLESFRKSIRDEITDNEFWGPKMDALLDCSCYILTYSDGVADVSDLFNVIYHGLSEQIKDDVLKNSDSDLRAKRVIEEFENLRVNNDAILRRLDSYVETDASTDNFELKYK